MGETFEPGAELAGGRYRIDGLLGSGGMAHVYRAWDTRLARAVAIKTMRPGLGLDEGYASRFRREARAMAALGHPNVVAVHDTGEEPNPPGPATAYFVMELVSGRSLSERLREGGALPPAEALEITDQVLSALAASHARGLVHRDVKPANILLTGVNGPAKVADFGIVRALAGDGSPLTGNHVMVGTPAYMSPEQVQGRTDLDGRSDLYAVGVLLFEMLTGRVPFDGTDAFTIGYRHVTEPPPTLSSYGVTGHPRVEAVLARALAKHPSERYADAREMRDALRTPRGGDTATTAASIPAQAQAPSPAPAPVPVPAVAPPVPASAPGAGHPPPPAGAPAVHYARGDVVNIYAGPHYAAPPAPEPVAPTARPVRLSLSLLLLVLTPFVLSMGVTAQVLAVLGIALAAPVRLRGNRPLRVRGWVFSVLLLVLHLVVLVEGEALFTALLPILRGIKI